MIVFTLYVARSLPGDRLRSDTVAPDLDSVAIGTPGEDDMPTGCLINSHTRFGYLHLSLNLLRHPTLINNLSN